MSSLKSIFFLCVLPKQKKKKQQQNSHAAARIIILGCNRTVSPGGRPLQFRRHLLANAAVVQPEQWL